MSKTSKDKLTIEKCRQEMAKQYKTKIETLEKENKRLVLENIELRKKVSDYEITLENTKEWIERMQDYVNMDDEELNALKNDAKIRKEFNDAFGPLAKAFGFGRMNSLFDIMGRF